MKQLLAFVRVGAAVLAGFISFHVVAQTGTPPAFSTVPMGRCGGLPCVDVTVGGAPLKLLIDTGNVNSALDRAAADRLHLTRFPIIGGDGKAIPGLERAIMPEVRLGSAVLVNVHVLVTDLAPDIKKGDMPAADGTLAYSAFKDRWLALDYADAKITVTAPLTADLPAPAPAATLSYPTFGKQGPPIVVATGFGVDGKEVTAQIDTLYSGSLLIYDTSVARLGLSAQQKSAKAHPEHFPFTDGGVDMLRATGDESFLGRRLAARAPLYFATPAVHAPDAMFDATVGQALFEKRTLTLDFHQNRVWLTP